MDPKVLGLIRHILTALGVILVSLGVFTEDVFGQITEAVLAILGGIITLFSVFKSWNAPEKLKARN